MTPKRDLAPQLLAFFRRSAVILAACGPRKRHMPFGLLALVALGIMVSTAGLAADFDFSRQLFGSPSTLSLWIVSLNPNTGFVDVNGVDTQGPTTPFTWDWGDGTVQSGWFPRQHTYGDVSRNYVLTVTSHYSGGATDMSELSIYFVSPQVAPAPHPADIEVTIPDADVVLGTRLYTPPILSHFDAEHFQIISRSIVEYVLTTAAIMQSEFVNGDVIDVDGDFRQIVLRDPGLSGGGMYSLWFTNPVSFAAGAGSMHGTVEYSSFMHEMGHNFTLNTPGRFYFGGRIDGNANAIYSETMAQIIQHATAYELINIAEQYGLPDELVRDIKYCAISAMNLVRGSYDAYVGGGASFHSWNDPATSGDETFGTFMTLAYKFCEHAETAGQGYRIPAKRMLQLLQTFDATMMTQYDRWHDTPAAGSFRATLMVAAISHAFDADLRSEFRALHFPIDDVVYDDLMGRVSGLSPPGTVPSTITLERVSPTTIRVAWPESDCAGGDDYGIYEGALGDWTSHQLIDCYDDRADQQEEVSFADGNRYYLVVPHNVASEGSYGTDSGMNERAAGKRTCALSQTFGCE